MISSATHTGDNEFELDGEPLGQVGRAGVRCGRGCVVCAVLGGESEEGGGDGGTMSIGRRQ